VSAGPEELPTTDRGRATRQALLDAAESTIAEFGYERASVAEITRRAGVAQGTFYIYFPDKKSIFTELVRHLNRKVRAAAAVAVEGAGSRQEMERQGMRAFFEKVVEEPAIYRIIREAEFVDHDAYEAHYATLSAPYTRGLQAAMESGEIADDLDPELLSYILMGIAEFMGMKLVLWGNTVPEEAVFDQLMTFIERGLGRTETP
jgi:AcrR family transcriptional regulator